MIGDSSKAHIRVNELKPHLGVLSEGAPKVVDDIAHKT